MACQYLAAFFFAVAYKKARSAAATGIKTYIRGAGLLTNLLLQTAAGLEAGDGGGLQLAGDLGLGVGEVLGLALTHFKTAEACDRDLVAALEHIANGPEDAVHNLLHLGTGHVGVVGYLGNQLRSRHDISNSYPYRHTMPVVITMFIIEKIVRRIKSF